jgi:glycosyltransferase involved in cell wall biosynthesis
VTGMSNGMLRVLHVFGQMMRGGAELRTIELAESFSGQRVRSDFLVLTGLDGPLDHRVRAAGGDVIKCPLDARFPFSFFRLLRQRRYDVVHSHVHYFSGAILAIARLAGTGCRVAHFHTAVVNDKEDTVRRRAQLAACRRLIQSEATDILAVGEGAMDGAWCPHWDVDPRCRVVYNGLPAERLRHLRVRTPALPVVINVASIQPLKNQVRLVGILRHSLRDLPELSLRLVGREVADYGLAVRRAAHEAGVADRVHFTGEVEDAMPLIAGSSLMILPSLWEGLPGAVLEACALGIPVLAADLPGTRELARHFPNLCLMPLDESDRAWAAAAVRLVRKGPAPAPEVDARFAGSPFTVARSREAYYQIWSRAHAPA